MTVKPKVGEALKLPCSPPKSYPKASVYWGINVRRINVLEAIKNDDRVLLDYEGKTEIFYIKIYILN